MNVKQGRNLTIQEALGFKEFLEDKGFKSVKAVAHNSSWVFEWLIEEDIKSESVEVVQKWLEEYERRCGCFS